MEIKIVTICGSMRFTKKMIDIALDLELTKGYAVLQCVYSLDDSRLETVDMVCLDAIHKKKIEISDAIYVVNIDGYIGNSTQSEINYALAIGKEVLYHERIN